MGFENLHAYWRMAYVAAPAKERETRNNPFARIPHEPDERAALLLHRSAYSYLVMNRFPYNAGHLLAVPLRVVPDLEDLGENEFNDFNHMILLAKRLLAAALHPDGFNIGINLGTAAGAGVPGHLHCHIVPRWNGDTNFMPVVAGTRVLPEALDQMWERLRSTLTDVLS